MTLTTDGPPEVPKIEMHHDIRDLLEELFPSVEESIRYQQMRALEKGDRLKNLWRRICEQTLWALRKNDLLRSPEDAAVIAAARAWAATWVVPPTEDSDRMVQVGDEDIDLYTAVSELPSLPS